LHLAHDLRDGEIRLARGVNPARRREHVW
jgi:hypothetical protein